LPVSILERLAASYGLGVETRHGERRETPRIALRVAGQVHRVDHRLVMEGVRAIVRDIGCSGVGALVCNNVTLGIEWVIWMGEFPETGRHSLALLCRTLRTRAAGPTQTLLRGRIEAILEPGQRLVPGRVLAGYRWIEASSTTPLDPLLKTAA